MDSIRRLHPGADLEFVPMDLSSLKSVAIAAAKVCADPRLDLLINNAGVISPTRVLTEDGFELHFGVNHFAHFALTGLLFNLLRATPSSRIPSI